MVQNNLSMDMQSNTSTESRKKIVVVLGMHRSGTSAITRGLQTLGVGLGDRLMAHLDDNPKGFWEDVDLNALNISMLNALGSDWHYLAPIVPNEVDILRRKGYFLRTVELLRQKTSNVPIFGFKDPRVAKLLPFWKEVIAHCQLDASYVLTLRHPLSVVKSLTARNGFDAEKCYLLWLGHVITSFSYTVEDQRVLIDYDRLMQSPDRELNRVAKKLNLEVNPTELQIYKTEFLDEGLRHTVYNRNDLLLDDACPLLAREIYSVLLDAAADNARLDDLTLHKQIVQWAHEFDRIKSALTLADNFSARINNQQVEHDQTVQALIAQVAEIEKIRVQQVAELTTQVAETEKIRAQQVAELTTQTAELDEKTAQLNEKIAQLNEKEQLANRLHSALYEIANSRSWKLFTMYQKVFGWLAPQNSFQYRILRKLYLGVSGAVLFLRKGLGYLRRNGVVGTAQAVVYIYKQRPRKVKLDLETKASLGRLLARLDIQLDAHQVLSSLVNAFGDERTRQIMANAADVEKTLSTDGGGEGFSIVQASQLPVASPDASSKKILFITAEFPDHLHGGGNRVLNFIKTLSEYNEIYLATSFYSEENGKMLSAIEPYCRSILKIPHVRFGENQDEIKKWLNGEIIDIVHYEWPRSLENYDPDFGKRQIFTYMEAVSLRLMMDMENFAPLSTSWLECFEQLAYAMRVELVLASHLDARVAVTTKDGEFFRKLFPYREYAVLNHGLGFDDFTLPDIQREPHTIVFVGNYRHYPNEDAMRFFFDKIWGNIRKEISDARIYVVGTNPPEFIARMADEKHLFVTGTVPDVRPYIQKAAVCIAPLISGAGLRGKVIEYAALRRPFVATSIATTDLIFKDAVDYFCADTAEKFSQQVIALLKDPQLSRQMGDSAYETARQNYDNRRLTGFLLSLYEYLEGKANEKQ